MDSISKIKNFDKHFPKCYYLIVTNNTKGENVIMLANPRKKWDKLGDLLEKEVRENLSKPRESQRPISQILRDFAKKYDTTVNSASFYYYEEIRDRIFNSDDKYIEDDITINSRKIKSYLEEKIGTNNKRC